MDPKDTANFVLDFDGKEEKCFDDYRWANIKYLSFSHFKDFVGTDITLYQDFNLNKGGIFWDGSFLLIQYFLQNYHFKDIKKPWIIELGSGTSLPSIVLKALNYNVVATDLKYLIEFVKKNISLNIGLQKTDNLFIKELEWGNEENIKEIQKINKKFDFIICSELIYIEESFDDLITTLIEFATETTTIIFSYRIRMREKFDNFMEKLKKNFIVEFIERKKLESIHPNENLHIMIAKIK